MKSRLLTTRIMVFFTIGLMMVSMIPLSMPSAEAMQESSSETSLEQEDVGDCSAVAFSSSNVDQLRGPDERFATYRVLYSGHNISIVGKFISPVDEALWWLIGDGSWIPSDAVDTEGDCENIREYTFEELFGLGIDLDTVLIADCIVTSDGDAGQQGSPTDDSPPILTASIFNFTISAQLILTLDELQWWLLSSGLWVPANSVEVTGPCDTVPLIHPNDLEELDADVCTIILSINASVFDSPSGDNFVLASLDSTLSNDYGAMEGVGQYEDEDGQLWWLLENGQWVKNSEAFVHGPCSDLPFVTMASDDTCVVRAIEPGARVRVGPGVNRGIFTALPVGEAFEVIGQFTSPDGLLWWQIQKGNLDPDGTAESLWVADSAVPTEGNCDNIQEKDPSPFVFNQNPSGDDTPTGDGGWGACGSCDSCGYNSAECVTSPEGQCLWDPTSCRGIPQGDDNCFALAVQITGLYPGSVNISPPSNCTTSTGSGGYIPGTVITATESGGEVFVGWTGCVTSTNSTVNFTMTGSCILTANYY